MKKQVKKQPYVVITTDRDKRGVFGGYLKSRENNNIVVLEDARMAVYWSAETHGVLGLASIGPQKGSRITPPVPQITLYGVTSISVATPDAQKQWELGLWN